VKPLYYSLMPFILAFSGCVAPKQYTSTPQHTPTYQQRLIGSNGYRDDPAYINLLTQRQVELTDAKIDTLMKKVAQMEEEKKLLIASIEQLRSSQSRAGSPDNAYAAVGFEDVSPRSLAHYQASAKVTKSNEMNDFFPVDLTEHTVNNNLRTKLTISRSPGIHTIPQPEPIELSSYPQIQNASYREPQVRLTHQPISDMVQRSTRTMFKVIYVFNDKKSWLHYDNFLSGFGVHDKFKRDARNTGEYVIYVGTFNTEAAAIRHKAYLARKTRTDHAIIRKKVIQL